MISSDPTKAAEDLEKWAAGLEKKARSYAELQNRLDQTSVTAEARDGAIRVTVDANGVPTGLELAERTRELPAGRLSAEILGCMRQAQARLRERVRDLVADTVPVDDDPARNLVAQYEQRFPGSVDDHVDEHVEEDGDRIGELPEEQARPEERPTPRPSTPDRPGPDEDEWDDRSPLRG